MNPISRGFRNAFRNGVRTGAIVIILGLSIGLALTMLIAQKAVDNKIASVKSSIGNTISISPAGFNPGSQTNNALTTAELAKLKTISNVTEVTSTLTDRQSTTGSSTPLFGRFGGESSDTSAQTTTSLSSPVTIDANSPRFQSGGNSSSSSSDSTAITTFSLPVSFLGTTDPTHVDGNAITIKSGTTISGTGDTNDALISEAMATKNNLKVGDTFTAYNATLTVKGIFTTSTDNRGAENTVVLSLTALQRLSGQTGVVTSATVTVNSLDNLSAATTAVKNSIGSSADVTSAQEQADNTVEPLNSVKKVSTFSLVGAVLAGAIIILLVMVMVVRERKKEIGVAKAIGGSNPRIIGEFMVEALTLAIMGAVIGLIIGIIGGQPVTKQLVTSSTSSATTTMQGPGGRSFTTQGGGQRMTGGPGGFGERFRGNSAVRGLNDVKAQIGPSILLQGFGAAILIAVLGSALAAGMIAKVRPSTIMRAD
ncbi:FtsX-like permease family protein [Candidatus Saccharibacteria bacterium]|nr:MAG: FtsX-like permease family protein [Candidatus Saccharibacteria bacterium]